MEELWKQTGDLVLRVGSEVLGRALTAQDNQRLIDEAVTQIRRSSSRIVARLSWPELERVPFISVK
jgi:hypothetical protein